MPAYACIAELYPNRAEEYERKHDEIWPEMVTELQQAGMQNYSIFQNDLQLFGYFETDDPVNGGVKTGQCGGAKVGHLVPRLGA